MVHVVERKASRLFVIFCKSWPGDPERHSEAARKGWKKRRWRDTAIDMPPLLPLSGVREAAAWYESNLAGRSIPTRYGFRVYCPPGLGPHLATTDTKRGRAFSAMRARRLSWIEPTIRSGRCFPKQIRARKDKRRYVFLAFFISGDRTGEDYVVIVRLSRRHMTLVTAFPPKTADYVERLIEGQKEYEPSG